MNKLKNIKVLAFKILNVNINENFRKYLKTLQLNKIND